MDGAAIAEVNRLPTAQMAWRMEDSGKPAAVGGRDKACRKDSLCRTRVAWGREEKKTSTLQKNNAVSSGFWG